MNIGLFLMMMMRARVGLIDPNYKLEHQQAMPDAPRRKVNCDESINTLPSSILTNSSRTSRRQLATVYRVQSKLTGCFNNDQSIFNLQVRST